eukprot:8097-Heterococcus_DN1.PRE.4
MLGAVCLAAVRITSSLLSCRHQQTLPHHTHTARRRISVTDHAGFEKSVVSVEACCIVDAVILRCCSIILNCCKLRAALLVPAEAQLVYCVHTPLCTTAATVTATTTVLHCEEMNTLSPFKLSNRHTCAL